MSFFYGYLSWVFIGNRCLIENAGREVRIKRRVCVIRGRINM